MARVSADTRSSLNSISAQEFPAAKWNSSVFSKRPDSVKALSQSLSQSLGRMRNPQIQEAVKQAAPASLETSIKSQSSAVTSNGREKPAQKEGLNTSIKKSYRDFLMQKKTDGKKENHEVLTLVLDKQILKLRAGEKLSNQELSNITNTMETVSTWLTSQMTGNDKTRALGPARDECLYILEKAKKRAPAELPSKASEAVSQPVSEKHMTPQQALQQGRKATPIKNELLLANFDKNIRAHLRNSESFDYESTVSVARSVFIKLENEGRLNSENLTTAFETEIKATLKNKINKQKLNTTEIKILNYKLTESFNKAKGEEVQQQISDEKMRPDLTKRA